MSSSDTSHFNQPDSPLNPPRSQSRPGALSPAGETAHWLRGSPQFSTTRWSLILQAGADTDTRAAAINEFCQIYWYPIYAFIRRNGHRPEEARDLAQSFFCRLLEQDWLQKAAQHRGHLSARLCASLKHFLIDDYRRSTAAKRGGHQIPITLDLAQAEAWYGSEPSQTETPERLLERQWAQAVMESALKRLAHDCHEMGRGHLYTHLHAFLAREPQPGEYDEVAVRMRLDRGAVAVAVHRLRKQYATIVRDEVASGLNDPAHVDEELRHLAEAL